ncbi:MAG TPA: DUF202 domain-containing protein [Streptosporangiaceae bacterium]|nr:DUF202 domain-containing protein [Streptosporangiaceae bacterium]
MMAPADDIEDADPGLARERTELAWTRTAISFAALGGVLLKSHPYAGVPILAVSAVIWELGRLARAPGAGYAQPRHLLLITVAVTGVSLAALMLSLLGSGSGGLR